LASCFILALGYKKDGKSFMPRNKKADTSPITIDFALILDQSLLPHIITDARSIIIYANDAACSLLGHTVDDLVGASLDLILQNPQDGTAHIDLMRYPRVITYEQRYQHRDGSTVDCEVTMQIIQEADTKRLYYVRTLQDIGQRKRRDEMLQTATHDLKNPLTNIRSASTLLKEVIDDEDEGLPILEVIEKAADRMFELVNSLLNFSRVDGKRLQPGWVSVNDFLRQLLDDFALIAEKKAISLRFVPLEPSITLLFDPSLMQQALNNLISNALKYTPEGGDVELSGLVTADEVIIQVIDNGIGIPKKEISNLFKPFYRVETSEHMAQDGTGLGLSLIKAIIEQHDGRIWVESTLGEGSTFYIALPLEEGED